MVNQKQIQELQNLISPAQNIAILLPEKPTADILAAGLAFSGSLTAYGKKNEIYCPSELTVEFSDLIGINKIKTKFESKNLVISFPYAEGSIEKVSYHVADEKFHLVIEPRNNFPTFSEDKIEYNYSGIEADLIFTIGVTRLADLGEVYNNNKSILSQKPIVNIDIKNNNENFGKLNIVEPESISLSEVITSIISFMRLQLDGDSASNLLLGITLMTGNFTSDKATALSFEAVGYCLRQGGKRKLKMGKIQKQQDFSSQKMIRLTANNEEKKAPEDWLKPKIFSSGGELK